MLTDTIKPYLIIGVGIAWSASLIGMAVWQNRAGHTAERVAWQLRENAELVDANAQIIQLNKAAREAEAASAVRQFDISTRLEKEKRDALAKKDFIIAGLRMGTVRLRDPGAPAVPSGGSGTGEAATPSCKCDGAAGGELSVETSEYLVSEASRADEIVKQLTECQAVVLSDRVTK